MVSMEEKRTFSSKYIFRSRRTYHASQPFRLRVTERKFLLHTVDLLIINGALMIALALRSDFTIAIAALIDTGKWFITLSVIWFLSATFFDCYDLARAASTSHSLRSSSMAVLSAGLIYTLTPFVTPPLQSRSLIFLFVMLTLLGIDAWRGIYAQFFVQPRFEQRALVIGAGERGRALVEMLKKTTNDANPFRGTGYHLVGFVDDRAEPGMMIADIPVLSGSHKLVCMIQALGVDEIILASEEKDVMSDNGFNNLLKCRELGLRVTTLPALYERLMARIPVDYVGPQDLRVVIPMEETAGERLYRLGKRVIDILAALVGILVVGILCPFIALANALTSPGALFYLQRRVGQGGRIFKILKFRTMIPNAEKNTGVVWAQEHDERITWVGRFLRAARLDELPQFINVLLGEMSLIGPRPERPEIIEDLAQLLPFYRARHALRPGITGWAQVEYRYGNNVEDAKVKLEYDLYYVKHVSPWLDLRILIQTIPIMLQGAGV